MFQDVVDAVNVVDGQKWSEVVGNFGECLRRMESLGPKAAIDCDEGSRLRTSGR